MTNTLEEQLKHHSEGFREPPNPLTENCFTYIKRIMEARDFIGFFFNFVKTSQKFDEIVRATPSKDAVPGSFELIQYNYSRHREFVNQILLSRAIESFNLYITKSLRDIFLSRPEMLKSEEKIDITTIIESQDYQEILLKIVERKVHELSYKSLHELRKFIFGRTGIELFESEQDFHTAILASEIRNLIAHNDCVANDVFKAKTKSVNTLPSISDEGRVLIDDDWLRKASYTLDRVVFRFDELAAEKFALKKRPLFKLDEFLKSDQFSQLLRERPSMDNQEVDVQN